MAEVEVEETELSEPAGLQLVEPLLYPDPAPAAQDSAARRELRREAGRLRRQVLTLQLLWSEQEFTDAHVFDASAPHRCSGWWHWASRASIRRRVRLLPYPRPPPRWPPWTRPCDCTPQTRRATWRAALGGAVAASPAACAALRQPATFNSFDRLEFVRTHANPLSRRLLALQRQLGIAPFVGELRALRPEAATLFDSSVFNPDFYTGNRQWFSNPAKVALGQQLFYDPVLSGGGGRSCASCHQPGRAFTDGLARSATLTSGTLRRNTPTILNAALQAGQFYDLRAPNLENQAVDVIGNRDEMHGSLDTAAGSLTRQPRYVARFREAFPEAAAAPGPLVSPVRIQNRAGRLRAEPGPAQLAL
ncbi:MAG: cytochrome-c peroxidase [Hymenobacter sp.]